MLRVMFGAVLCFSTLLPVSVTALAADYPRRPIRVAIPFPPGGTSDILTRIIGEKLSASLGQQIVVDNRPGAGGVIATDIVAKSNPDGYTLYMTFVSHAINPYVYAKLPYSTEKDFAPVALFAVTPNVVVVTPSLVAPADGDSVLVPYPTFVWTPVLLGANAAVSYHLRVSAILPGQSPLDALNNVPQYEADLTSTAASYPADAFPLEDETQYVWQVQALDGAGQPVGERQGKSEAWTFAMRSASRIAVAGVDSVNAGDGEPAVGQFKWAGLDVKVLSVRDSARGNFTGRGRIKVIPGVFEPSFEFKSLRMNAAGTQVAFAPRHVINLPLGDGILDYALKYLPAQLFFVNLQRLVLIADSAGEQYAGLSGSASLFLGFGVADSIANGTPIAVPPAAECPAFTVDTTGGDPLGVGDDTPLTVDTTSKNVTICRMVNDIKAVAGDSAAKAAIKRIYQETLARSLFFTFDNLGVAPSGPRGTLRLGRDFSTGVFGLENAKITLAADSTILTLADGGGVLDLQGTFLFPPGVGLIKDQPDTTWTNDTPKKVKSVDSTITLSFTHGRVGTDGELFIHTAGIPRAKVGQTGLRLQSGDAWIDLSGSASPPGREQGWRGVYFDSVRVFLPSHWHTPDIDPPERAAPGNVQIAGYRIAVDGSGLSGVIVGSQLEKLGPIVFGGFRGQLDSLRFVFASGTLEEGYVEGQLRVPFLDGDLPYWVAFTPTGVERAYAKLTAVQRYPMPALGGELLLQRAEFTYDRPVGTFSCDAKLSINREGVALRDVQVYGLTISNDGGIKLRSGWLALDHASEAGFNSFPVVVDSIGFGSGSTGNEVWLGVAGRFSLNDNLPASKGAFRVFAVRDAPGAAWAFSRFAVDRLDVNYENGAVQFRGALEYVRNDSIYGNAFKAAVRMAVQNKFTVDGTFIAGATSFRYWYVDAKLLLPPPGIQLGTLPLSLYGFGGGAYARMRAQIDSLTLKTTYVPDATTAFGLKAIVSLGTTAQQGLVWNADVTLEAAVGASGGLQSLTLRGDNWMLTEVSKREQKIWGTVLIDLPVSQPVLHANLTLNVNLPPALLGGGWAELHFEPSKWYVNVGTPQRPDSMRLLPASLNLKSTAFFQMDRERVAAGFDVHFSKSKTKGIFRGNVNAGFEANGEMRYRPFQATGEGELWGDVKAEVKALGNWYEIFSGELRASMAFRFPDPMGVWGRVRMKYSVANGAAKGTYRMRYSWGDAPDDGESDSAQFVIVAATYPAAGDTAAPLTGMTYYLGMNENTQYGMDDGVYRLRQTGTPQLLREVITTTSVRDARTGRTTTRSLPAWQSIGTVVRDWLEDRGTLVLKAPGSATLQPASKYRALVTFVLEKQGSSGSWSTIQTVNSSVDFRTTGYPAMLAQLVTETDPRGGATPLYIGGTNAGAVRVQFSNTHPDLTSGAVRAVLIANGTDTVPGTWGTSSYTFAAIPRLTLDPTLYAFRPAAGALLASTAYRFAIVSTDSGAREHYGVNFVTSRYATLVDHVNASTRSVTVTKGPGPVGGGGNYLLRAQVIMEGTEAMTWTDVDSIEVVGLANWTVTPRTRCHWAGGLAPQYAALPSSVGLACGAPPTYENVLDVKFAAPADASLPPASTSNITIRLNHRREGWRSFTFPFPTLQETVAAATQVMVAVPPSTSTPGKKK